MDLPAVVVEHCPPAGRRQSLTRCVIEVECRCDVADAFVVPAVDIDPEQLRTVQRPRPLRQMIESLYLISSERIAVLTRSRLSSRVCNVQRRAALRP